MKKFAFYVIPFICLIANLPSLAQKIDALSERQIKDFCRSLAAQHSSALATIYTDLGGICSPREQIDQKIDTKAANFVKGNLQSTVYDNIDFSGTKMPIGQVVSEYLRSMRYPFSEVLYTALDEIEQFVSSETTLNAFSVNIESYLDNKFAQLTNNVEKLILAGAAFIAVDSYNYWKTHIDDWSIAIAETNRQPAGFNLLKTDPSTIAKTDLGGAVTGLVRGAYAGLTVGSMAIPGIGTVAGGAVCCLTGMIGGAILSSANAGIKCLISRLFD
jgi:hypothetical protein